MTEKRSIPISGGISAWTSAKLGEVTSLLQDGTHFSPSSKTGSFRYLTSKNIRTGHLDLTKCEYISAEEHKRIYAACPVQKGDVLLTKDGASVGNVCLNTLEEPFSLLSSVAVIRGKKGILDNQFLLQYLMSPIGQNAIRSTIAGQAITRITVKSISGLRIPMPLFAEQQQIAKLLKRWDQNIDLLRRLLKLKGRLKQGLLQKLLSRHESCSMSAGNRWLECRLGDLLEEVTRPHVLVDDQPYRLVSVRRRSGGLFDREPRLGREIGYNSLEHIHTGDFLIARWQVLHGALAIVPKQFDGAFVSNAYAILVSKPGVALHMPFLNYFSQQRHFYYLAERCSYGVAIEKMFFRLDWFLKETIRIPPTVEEQTKIANVFRTLDHEIALLEQKLEALRMQKRGLMQKLLSGQIRLKILDGN